ncbi:MAG: hypothetical protein IKX74_00590 [Erysipelotrichaceae bacterium]|nr:hypothetical protein [Erysipelotrichaceae bacterium]
MLALLMCLVFLPLTAAAEDETPGTLEDGYYLIDITDSENHKILDKMIAENTGTEDVEYMLQTDLTTGQKIKVVALVNGAIPDDGWYPGGFGNEFVVPESLNGSCTIFFRPYYYPEWANYGGGGFFYIGKNYPITITTNEFGTVTSNYEQASRHTKIILTVTPNNDHCSLSSLTVKDDADTTYELHQDGDSYWFIILEKPIFVTAEFETEYCTVTFLNWDNSELQKGQIPYGEMPVYRGDTPTREETPQYSYTFAGWDREIAEATESTSYKATYTQTTREYAIRFLNYDNEVLQNTNVAYGETPVYTGQTPEKPHGEDCYYEFTGWEPEITDVTGPQDYVAVFQEHKNPVYTVSEGADGSWAKGSSDGYVLKVSRDPDNDLCFDKYSKTLIDNVEVSVSAASGSTVITISPEVLEQLETGEHEIFVEFTDGEVSTTLTITETQPTEPGGNGSTEPGGNDTPEPGDVQTPDTGDLDALSSWLTLSSLSLMAISSSWVLIRRRED